MEKFRVKFLWVIGFLIFCLFVIFLAVSKFNTSKVVEFRNIGTDYVYYNEGGYFNYNYSFLVNNCPTNTTETYEVISEYVHNNFDYDGYTYLLNELQRDRNVKELYIFARFFKVSRTLPWDWQPKYANGILSNDDTIDNHLNDCIGCLSISPINDGDDLEVAIDVYLGTAQEFSTKEIWKSNI
ncbi:MAG: hypothetical protein K2O14_03350 [Oscillospiraceae bacterium]|nr:hypothetical protein [Oscillospiraceae bacterium]